MGHAARRLSAAAVLATVTLFAGCGGDSPVELLPCEDTGTCGPKQVDADAINQFVTGLPGWTVGVTEDNVTSIPAAPVFLLEDEFGDPLDYRCQVDRETLVRPITDISALDVFEASNLYPGALIQGKTLEDGTLKLIPLKRMCLAMSSPGISKYK